MSVKFFQEESDCIQDVTKELDVLDISRKEFEDEDSELECPICYTQCMPPRIPRCENGHLICYLCKCKLTSSLCPICRAEFVLNRPLVAEAVAKLIPFPCKNAKLGCPQQLPWKTRQKHEEKCSYQSFFCPLLTCPGAAGSIELLKQHVNHSHKLGPRHGQLSVYKNSFASFSTYLSPKIDMMATQDLRFFWWEPQMFVYEFACFLMCFREVDNQNKGHYYFWLWMAATPSQLKDFKYRICIEDPTPSTPRDPEYTIGSSPEQDRSILLVDYLSTPVSLQASIQDIQDQNLCLKLDDHDVQRLLSDGGPNCNPGCDEGCQCLKYSVLVRKEPRSKIGGNVTPVQ